MRLIDADALIKEYEEIVKTLADFCETERMMCREVIRALQNAPTIEPIVDTKSCGVSADRHTDQNVADVPSGDLISRAEATSIPFLPKEHRRYQTMNIDDAYEQGWCDLEECIQSLPSADRPQVNSAEWVAEKEKEFEELHRPDYSYEADMVKRLKEATSADKPNYNLETIADIVKQLGHLDGCIADMCDRPQVNSNSAEEQIAETCDRPKGDPEPEPAPVVAYICDRRRCAICRGEDGGCDHTTDIKHAAHFKNVAGQYFERPYMEEEDDGDL